MGAGDDEAYFNTDSQTHAFLNKASVFCPQGKASEIARVYQGVIINELLGAGGGFVTWRHDHVGGISGAE